MEEEIEEINAQIRQCFLRIIDLKDKRRKVKEKYEGESENEPNE